MGFEVIANIYPTAGKEKALEEGLTKLAESVKNEEKGCSKYQVYRQTNEEGEPAQFVVVEECVLNIFRNTSR
jgi:quinol monooxygenase YgiN